MNKTLFELMFVESDPYYSREVINVLILYFMISDFYSGSGFFPTVTANFVSSLSAGYFLATLLYSSIVSGAFARSIERGSLGLLMTMPVNRPFLILLHILEAVFFGAVFLILPAVVFEFPVFYGVKVGLSGMLFIILLGTLSLYMTSGFLVAAITGNSILTFMFVFGGYFLIGLDAQSVFENSYLGQFLLSGFNFLSVNYTIGAAEISGSIIMIMISSILALLVYPILRFKGIRSGR